MLSDVFDFFINVLTDLVYNQLFKDFTILVIIMALFVFLFKVFLNEK